MIKKAHIKNGILVDMCDEKINLECDSYIRQDGKAIYKKVSCGSIYREEKRYILCGVNLLMKDVISYMSDNYGKSTLISMSEDKEQIAKLEGLQNILSSSPRLYRYEYRVVRKVDINCMANECIC